MLSICIVQKNKGCHRLTFAKHTLSLGFTLNVIIEKKTCIVFECVCALCMDAGRGKGYVLFLSTKSLRNF